MKWETMKEAFEVGVRESINVFKSGDISPDNLATAVENVADEVRRIDESSNNDNED